MSASRGSIDADPGSPGAAAPARPSLTVPCRVVTDVAVGCPDHALVAKAQPERFRGAPGLGQSLQSAGWRVNLFLQLSLEVRLDLCFIGGT
jgi:hypothetical protein